MSDFSGDGESLAHSAKPMGAWHRIRLRGAKGGNVLLLVSLVVLFDTVFYSALTPLLPHYVHSLGLSDTEAGYLVAAYPAGALLGALPAGAVAARIGTRLAVLIGLAGMSGGSLVFGFGRSAILLEGARFAQGLSEACTWAGGLGWLAAATPADQRGTAFGKAFGAAVGGAVLGPAVGSVASVLGTGPTFTAVALVGLCLLLASVLVPKVVELEVDQSMRSTISALTDGNIKNGLWLSVAAGFALGTVNLLAPLRLSRLGASSVIIGATFLCASGMQALVSPFVGRQADLHGRATPVQVSLVLAIVVALLIPISEPVGVLVAVLVLGISTFGTLFVPAAAMISDGAGTRRLHQGMAFGLSSLAWATGQAVGSASSGALAQATNDTVPYLLVVSLCAATLLVRHFSTQ